MIQFVCEDCGTKRRFSDDLAGKRIVCRVCGRKSVLPRSSDDDDDDDEHVPATRRRKTTKPPGRKLGPKMELFLWLCAGGSIALVATFMIMLALVKRPRIGQALALTFPVGWVVIAVYFMLMFMGFRGAIGAGVRISRERRLEGKAGVQTGIAILLSMAVLTIGGLELSGVPPEPEHDREILHNQPQPDILNADTTDERRRFTDSTRGFSLIPPPGWEIRHMSGDARLMPRNERRRGLPANAPEPTEPVFVGTILNDGFVPMMDFAVYYHKISLDEYASSVPGSIFAVYEDSPSGRAADRRFGIYQEPDFQTASGLRGKKVITKARIGGRMVRQTCYFFGKSGRNLFFTAAVPETEAPALDATLDASARTFRFEECPADATNERRRIQHSHADLTIIPPPDWELHDKWDKVRRFRGPILNGFQTGFDFDMVDAIAPIDKFIEDFIARQMKNDPTFRVISQSEFETTSSLIGVKFVAERIIDGQLFRVTHYFLGQERRKTSITMSIPATEGPEMDEMLEASVKTVRRDGERAKSRP